MEFGVWFVSFFLFFIKSTVYANIVQKYGDLVKFSCFLALYCKYLVKMTFATSILIEYIVKITNTNLIRVIWKRLPNIKVSIHPRTYIAGKLQTFEIGNETGICTHFLARIHGNLCFWLHVEGTNINVNHNKWAHKSSGFIASMKFDFK